MKILYILPSLKNKGPIVVAHDLVSVFTHHGHQCKVVYFDEGEELDFPCPTQRISLKEKMDFNVYDVVHAHGFRPQLYVTLHKPLTCKAKFITTQHNYVFNDFRYDYGKVKGILCSWLHLVTCLRFDTIVTLSQNARIYYRRFFPMKHFEVAYNTTCRDAHCDLTEAEKQQVKSFKGDSFLLGTCCVLIPRKRVEVIIKALSLMPDVKFLVVGDGVEMPKLKELAKSLDVAKRVLFVGRKPQGYRYMKHLDAFTLTSTSEGFPLSLLEAASFGTPAITSDLPVYHELFADDEIVILPSVEAEAVVGAVRKIMKNQKRYSEKIKEKFESAYSPNAFYEKHLAIYQK